MNTVTVPVGQNPATPTRPRTRYPARRTLAVVALAFLALVGMAGPAAAEGGFSTSMANVRVGFESRTWTDHNNDGVSTKITLSGCTHNWSTSAPKSFTLELFQEHWYGDSSKGRKTFVCGSSADSNSWGDLPAGSYHFTVKAIAGLTQPQGSARSVVVVY